MCKTSQAVWNGSRSNDKGSGGMDGSGGDENAKILIGIDMGKQITQRGSKK